MPGEACGPHPAVTKSEKVEVPTCCSSASSLYLKVKLVPRHQSCDHHLHSPLFNSTQGLEY